MWHMFSLTAYVAHVTGNNSLWLLAGVDFKQIQRVLYAVQNHSDRNRYRRCTFSKSFRPEVRANECVLRTCKFLLILRLKD